MDLLRSASNVAMLGFVISSMLAMGLGLTIAQIMGALGNGRLVLLVLVANFILMPLGALLLGRVLALDEPLAIGLLLVGCAAGAPFLPKLAQLAKGELPLAVGIMVLLMVITVGYMPLVLPVLLTGVTVNPWNIARSLIFLMLLPLGIGLLFNAYGSGLAARLKPFLDWIGNASLILLITLMLVTNFAQVVQVLGRFGILAALLLVALGYGLGWLLGGPDKDSRRVVGLGTAQRNVAAALVVGQSFSDPEVTIMVIVVALVGLITLMPLARILGRRLPDPPAQTPIADGHDAVVT